MQPSRSPRPAAFRGDPELRETAVPYFARPMPELSVRFDSELSTWLRLAAQARAGSPQTLAAELLTRGLQQEARRDRTRRLLQRLTPRERQVTELTADGRTNRQIAYALRISTETVKSHVRNTLGKFGLRSKEELRLLLQETGTWEDAGSASPRPP
jgi:DNA-binding NarL/FixJ family response regulator